MAPDQNQHQVLAISNALHVALNGDVPETMIVEAKAALDNLVEQHEALSRDYRETLALNEEKLREIDGLQEQHELYRSGTEAQMASDADEIEALRQRERGLLEQLAGMESMREAAQRERDGLKEQLEKLREHELNTKDQLDAAVEQYEGVVRKRDELENHRRDDEDFIGRQQDKITGLLEQFDTLHEIAVRVSEADNQRLAAEGEPGFEAMREMEDALAALHQYVGSNPASSQLEDNEDPMWESGDARAAGADPARELAPSEPRDNETGGSLVETPDPASRQEG